MPIEMPRGVLFSVDTWSPRSKRKRYHFLTHAHRDHLAGISSNASYPIYSTAFTKSLVMRYFPQIEEALFVEIEAGESMTIDDPDAPFSVAAFDANHCPGAVMFLFEGEFGNILHTGDCRLTPECLQYLPLKYLSKKERTVSPLDYLFLDCTFGRCSLNLPSKQSAIQQVINCIWKHPNAPVVYLACDLLGQEEILVEVSRTFGSKIFVDKINSSECFQALLVAAPEILSEDTSCHFQVVEGFPRLGERAKETLDASRAKLQPEPLFIRPSAQWYASDEQGQKPSLSEAQKDEFGVWHVCYSMHSSREELEQALQLLQPKWVISTTPPCRAMELHYVKIHCFKTHITRDDPLWKLLNLSPIKSSPSLKASVDVEIGMPTSALKILPTELKLDLPVSSTTQPITLFGRARLGLPDSDIFFQEEKSISTEDALSFLGNITEVSTEKLEVQWIGSSVSFNDDEPIVEKSQDAGSTSEMSCIGSSRNINASLKKLYRSIGSSVSFNDDEPIVEKSQDEGSTSEMPCIGSSRNINASLKKLYRSMNAPIPKPLPSLVGLMNRSKRV